MRLATVWAGPGGADRAGPILVAVRSHVALVVASLNLGCQTRPADSPTPTASGPIHQALAGSAELVELDAALEACPQLKPVMYWLHTARYVEARDEATWVDRLAPGCESGVERAFRLLDAAIALEPLLKPEVGNASRGEQLRAIVHPALRELALRAIPNPDLQRWLGSTWSTCASVNGVTKQCLEAVEKFEEVARFSSLAGRGRQLLRRERENDIKILEMRPEMVSLIAAYGRVCKMQECAATEYGDCFQTRPHVIRENGASELDRAWEALGARLPAGPRRDSFRAIWSLTDCARALPTPEGE